MTQKELKQILSYDESTGVFTWIPTAKRNAVPAGKLSNEGYLIICINGTKHRAHRLAWLYVHGKWPDELIDHIDGDRANNRITNLREATPQQNLWNAKKKSTNKTGFKGVGWHDGNQKYHARITKNGVTRTLGYFNTKEEAFAAYAKAAVMMHGEFSKIA